MGHQTLSKAAAAHLWCSELSGKLVLSLSRGCVFCQQALCLCVDICVAEGLQCLARSGQQLKVSDSTA